MNNNQIMLQALENLKEKKQSEFDNYMSDVYRPKIAQVNAHILEYLQNGMDETISKVDYDVERLTIGGETIGGEITIRRKRDWSDWNNPKMHCELNWYGSSATSNNEDKLAYLKLLGNVAAAFSVIEASMLDEEYGWPSLVREVNDTMVTLDTEIRKINGQINEVKQNLRIGEIKKYKEVGAKISISKYTSFKWVNDKVELIKDTEHLLKLRYGRTKWDYMYVSSYEVLNAKGKVRLKVVTHQETTPFEIELSQKRFDEFVESVYEWNTEKCQFQSDWSIKKYRECMERMQKTA